MPSFRALPPSLLGREPPPRIPRGRRQTYPRPGRPRDGRLRDLRRRRATAGQVHPRRRAGQGPRTRGRGPEGVRVDRSARTRRASDAGGGAQVFGLHPLAVEDAVHAHQRPKVERYDDTLFLVLKTVKYVPHESVALAREIVETGEIMVFVGADFVVTVRHGDHTGLAGLRQSSGRRTPAAGAGPVRGDARHRRSRRRHLPRRRALMECDIDAIESETFSSPSKTDIEPIYMLKREVVELRRAVSPLTVALQTIQHRLQGPDVQRDPALHARRAGPPDPGRRPDRQL